MEICRACLSTETQLVVMDSAHLDNFNKLTNLNITPSKEMLLHSCNTCLEAIKFCTEFREKCLESDLTLKELLLLDNKEVAVKNEAHVKLEYESDSTIWEDYIDYSDPCDNQAESSSNIETKEEDFTPIRKSGRLKTKDELKNKKACDIHLEEVVDDNEIKICGSKPMQSYKRHISKEADKTKKKKPKVTKTNLNIVDDKLENCGICLEVFDGRDNLLKHLEHHKWNKWCEICTVRFMDFVHVLSHRIKHIPKKQRSCHICCKRILSTNSLEFHYVKTHNLRGEVGRLLCMDCPTSFECPDKLRKHVWSVHSGARFQCDNCGKVYGTKSHLRLHMRLHYSMNMLSCSLCEYKSKYTSSLKEHIVRKHTEGRVYCKACGRAYASKELLAKHTCKQIPEVICPFCGIHVKKLTRHMKIHTNQFRYKCERCPSQYKSLQSFRAHQNKHDGKRPFQCSFCTMSFYTQSVLIKHRRTHTGEKPYVCKICAKGFTSGYNLKVHMKVHGQDLVVKRNNTTNLKIFV